MLAWLDGVPDLADRGARRTSTGFRPRRAFAGSEVSAQLSAVSVQQRTRSGELRRAGDSSWAEC
ncbi:MAG: hypothetical protein MZV64_70890 [Ignavibacteriales bacterium]|nr:hypothetical protein [Ignavibacteriales bacterium]